MTNLYHRLMSDILTEEWRPVVGYEGLYEVSNIGRVRSVTRKVLQRNNRIKVMKGKLLTIHNRSKKKNTYKAVRLSKENVMTNFNVHTLVAEAFLGPRPKDCLVLHGPLGRWVNTVNNLRYGSAIENAEDREKDGKTIKGEQMHTAKLTSADVLEIRKELELSATITALGKKYNVSKCTILDIKVRRTWKHI